MAERDPTEAGDGEPGARAEAAAGAGDPGRAARALLRRGRAGVLATALKGRGAGVAAWPYGSLVTFACDLDGSPIFLFSKLADHRRNLDADARASLLISEAFRRRNPQTGPRVALLGRIQPSKEERHRRRFLARHPDAQLYAGFADFRFHVMRIERAHYVGGFAAARWLKREEVAFADADSAAVAAIEADVLRHMNEDHGQALDLYANRLLGRRGKGWTAIALDPEGLDLRRGGAFARLDFARPVGDAASVRAELVRLAHEARKGSKTGRK